MNRFRQRIGAEPWPAGKPRAAISHPDIVRQKIRTSQLINRLHSHIFGTLPLTDP